MNVALYSYKNYKPAWQFLNVIFLYKVQWPGKGRYIFHFEITVTVIGPCIFVSTTKENTCIFGARDRKCYWLSKTSHVNLKRLWGKVLETEGVTELDRLYNMGLQIISMGIVLHQEIACPSPHLVSEVGNLLNLRFEIVCFLVPSLSLRSLRLNTKTRNTGIIW
jgi:hypothetical protein